MAVHHHGQRPGAVRDNRFDAEVHEGRRQTGRQQAYVGSRLKPLTSGKAPPDRPAFQPYWGKPAVRNERGDRGNVGIIRSPVRASILPDRNDDVSDSFLGRNNAYDETVESCVDDEWQFVFEARMDDADEAVWEGIEPVEPVPDWLVVQFAAGAAVSQARLSLGQLRELLMPREAA